MKLADTIMNMKKTFEDKILRFLDKNSKLNERRDENSRNLCVPHKLYLNSNIKNT